MTLHGPLNVKSTYQRQWLSPDGVFLFGKYEGQNIEYISTVDYSYVKWIVETIEDISDEDREVMQSYLTFRHVPSGGRR